MPYTGQRHEAGLGLYDYNARYYDPVLGRFIQADTIVPDPPNPQSFNRYTYVVNNPFRYTDPTGHWYYDEGADALVHTRGDDSQLRKYLASLAKPTTDVFAEPNSAREYGEPFGKIEIPVPGGPPPIILWNFDLFMASRLELGFRRSVRIGYGDTLFKPNGLQQYFGPLWVQIDLRKPEFSYGMSMFTDRIEIEDGYLKTEVRTIAGVSYEGGVARENISMEATFSMKVNDFEHRWKIYGKYSQNLYYKAAFVAIPTAMAVLMFGDITQIDRLTCPTYGLCLNN